MFGNYTQAANNRCFNVLDDDIYKIWDTIESLSEDETAEAWKEKITAIADEYSFSSRFALMRIVYSRNNMIALNEAFSEDPFEIDKGSEILKFSGLTMDVAKNLPEKELKQYEEILCDIASRQADSDEKRDRLLIVRALRDGDESENIALSQTPEGSSKTELAKIKKESRTLLNREEALALGHSLEFTLEEMSWFLLRVFDFEDGFRYNISDDLIEAYAFLIGASSKKAEELKAQYDQLVKDKKGISVNERAADWTQNVSESLPELTVKWSIYPEDRDEKFLDWINGQKEFLNLPSRTATNLYRKLSCYVYEISEKIISTPTREAYIKEIKNICMNKSQYEDKADDLLRTDNVIDSKKCKIISGNILDKNKDLYTSAPDKSKAWRTITSDEQGLPRLIMAGRPDASRSRVQDLLEGVEQIEKGDILHMLWYGFNLCWEEAPITDNMSDLQWNLADFTETCEMVLDAALLAPFYPPHIMEQSMMLSIVVSSEDDGIPATNYATLCESLIKPRNRKKSK